MFTTMTKKQRRPIRKSWRTKQSDHDVPRNRQIQRYDDKTNATVAIGGNNNGHVVVHSGNEGNISTGHRETLEQVGEISSLETEQDLIRTYVNGTLWKKKKFVALSQGELDWNSQICRQKSKQLLGKQELRFRAQVFGDKEEQCS
jgi:hypothetical protein